MSTDIGYARHEGAHLAYRIDGDGPVTLVYLRAGPISIDSFDDEPRVGAFFRRLGSFARVVRLDPRGVGLTDPLEGEVTVAGMARDALAVADAIGAERFAVLGEMSGGPVAIALAALAPERVSALVLINTYARVIRDEGDGYPYGHPQELVDSFLGENFDPEAHWEADGNDDVALVAPSMANDAHFREWWSRAGRRGASPATAHALQVAVVTADERDRLAELNMPTLVMHRRDSLFLPVELGRYLGEHIPGARYVELDGADAVPWVGQPDDICDEIEEFLTSRRSGSSGRVLATVLFTDIVGSTDRLAEVGDQSWHALLDLHDTLVRTQLARYGGSEVSTVGDGFFATFTLPSRAIECARAIIEAARAAGIDVRAGVHAGECDVRGDDYGGLTVVIGARVGALASKGEVLVTSTVRDLVMGAPFTFSERGAHRLKGVPGEWRLLALG